MKTITKDPRTFVPNVKEGDFLAIYLENDSYTDICFTEYYKNSDNVSIVHIIGYHNSMHFEGMHDFGWNRKTLIKLLIDTYNRWKLENINRIVKYYVIDDISDLYRFFALHNISLDKQTATCEYFRRHLSKRLNS